MEKEDLDRASKKNRVVATMKQGKTQIANQAGELLHTKHAFPPNTLGYCGPDIRGRIQDYLHNHSDRDDISSVLKRFEAAYPFVKMIGKSNGRDPFDYHVAEAYWLGNSLLDNVEPAEFFSFVHQDLSPSRKLVEKGDGMRKDEVKSMFGELGGSARPHHTFYVLGIHARQNVKSAAKDKLLKLMDSCRISCGMVMEVKRDTLVVERRSLTLKEEMLSLARPNRKEIRYDPEIESFSKIHPGEWVSIHWDFACETLTGRQLRNLKRYTALDIEATNKLVASLTVRVD